MHILMKEVLKHVYISLENTQTSFLDKIFPSQKWLNSSVLVFLYPIYWTKVTYAKQHWLIGRFLIIYYLFCYDYLDKVEARIVLCYPTTDPSFLFQDVSYFDI